MTCWTRPVLEEHENSSSAELLHSKWFTILSKSWQTEVSLVWNFPISSVVNNIVPVSITLELFQVCPLLKVFCPVTPDSFTFLMSFSCVPFVGSAEYDRRWLYVELLSEVFDALRPSSLVEDAEDAAGLPTVLQSPGAQRCEQRL